MKTFSAILFAAALANRLPTGATLDPVEPPKTIGNFPLALVASPDGNQLVALLCGWRQQGVQVIDRATRAVTQTQEESAAFVGLVFSPDGRTLYASGGNDDVIRVYRWENGRAIPDGHIALHAPRKPVPKTKLYGDDYPAGLALSPDGKFLYVAANTSDAMLVIDAQRRAVIQRVNTDRYPYGVVADANHVYVSCWGDSTLNAYTPGRDGLLSKRMRIAVSRHPSAMLLRGPRLFVTSATTDRIDVVRDGKVVNTLTDSGPATREGSTPNALEVSSDGKRLFVAEADNNAVAIFDLATRKLLGRVPTDWYPSALVRVGRTICVANAKGRGTAPDPDRVQPPRGAPDRTRDYTLGQLDGSIVSFPENISDLDALSARVAKANGWNAERTAATYPPFKHVIYIIKENRTYDQVLGDMSEGDGDRSLVYFGEANSPNHHALARRFGLFDRFFVNAEVSADGHNWSTAAYVSDYAEKTVPSQYSSRRKDYDYGGTNRDRLVNDEDDVNSPSTGYLWDAVVRKKITLRNYGEFEIKGTEIGRPDIKSIGTKSALRATTAPAYVGWDLDVPDQNRVDAWIAEFNRYVAGGNLPALEIMSLPNDHTAGAQANKPTPRAYMADNDLALGRIVEALSHSPYWRDTVIFVLEDDAQSGPDHVDSHRSVLLTISAYNKSGVVHRFTNTTDVVATIEEILGLSPLSQFDYFGRPLRGIFASAPDLTPYTALKPAVDMNEKNPPGPKSDETMALDFSRPDAIDDDTLNRILWRTIKGQEAPYPGPTRAPAFVGN